MPIQPTYKNTYSRPRKRPENIAILCPLSTGKEKDSETGYYYFGARYYNSDLSLWLSVDPMSDKYPSLSPYNYCTWNPVKLVDPDGRDTFKIHIDKGHIEQRESSGKHCIMFYKGGKQLKHKTKNNITTKINYNKSDPWMIGEVNGSTEYLEFEDALLGKSVFDIIVKESYNSNSAKEWDFYFHKKNGGELSSSGQGDMMAHATDRYTSENVKSWHHFHPHNTDKSWFPSFSDQNRSRNLGVPSYLYNQGEVRRFDEVVKPRNLNPSEYGRKFGLCH